MLSRSDLNQIAKTMNGIPVLGCLPGSPAALAGVRYGDVILSVNGVRTTTVTEYLAATGVRPERMRMTVFRDGSEMEIGFDLGAPKYVEPGDLMEVLREMLPDPDLTTPQAPPRVSH